MKYTTRILYAWNLRVKWKANLERVVKWYESRCSGIGSGNHQSNDSTWKDITAWQRQPNACLRGIGACPTATSEWGPSRHIAACKLPCSPGHSPDTAPRWRGTTASCPKHSTPTTLSTLLSHVLITLLITVTHCFSFDELQRICVNN